VGQTIGLCRLLPRAFGPRNFMKKGQSDRVAQWSKRMRRGWRDSG
jgi:hypothetical protein